MHVDPLFDTRQWDLVNIASLSPWEAVQKLINLDSRKHRTLRRKNIPFPQGTGQCFPGIPPSIPQTNPCVRVFNAIAHGHWLIIKLGIDLHLYLLVLAGNFQISYWYVGNMVFGKHISTRFRRRLDYFTDVILHPFPSKGFYRDHFDI